MLPSATRALLFSALALVSSAVAASGCSHDPPPKAPAASGPAAPASAAAAGRDAPGPAAAYAASPTGTAVQIDDAIIKACGIAAPKAFFAFDSAKLVESDLAPLAEVATCLLTGPLAGRALKVVGHADPRGENEYNMVLGQSRADAVGGYLGRRGLDKTRVASTTRGALDSTGTDDKGWARDRRVDVLLGN